MSVGLWSLGPFCQAQLAVCMTGNIGFGNCCKAGIPNFLEI